MRKQKLKIFILLLLLLNNLSSQNYQWAKGFGGTWLDNTYSNAVDASGNVLTVGNFSGIVDFDPGIGVYNLTSTGSGAGIFVVKLDANGNFIWAASLGGQMSDDCGAAITVDALGNVFSSGNFSSTSDFDPGASTYTLNCMGNSDIYISKLDLNGNFVWAKSIGDASYEYCYSMVSDGSANIYLTGRYGGTVDFDPGPSVNNLISQAEDIYILKLDQNGIYVWSKSIGGSLMDIGYSIALDGLGNVYTTGFFIGTVDFDPNAGVFNLTSSGNPDAFISKLDNNGIFLWAKSFGGSGYDYGNGIKVDAIGNVYSTGYYEAVSDFDPNGGFFSLTSVGCTDIFVSKLDMNGNFIWAKSAGGSGCERGNAISISSNAVYVGGHFELTCDFNPPLSATITSNGWLDVFVAKYSTNSTEIDEKEIESVLVYPNPNSGNELFIKRNSFFVIDRISIYNALGSLVSSENIINNNNEIISLGDLPKKMGIYILKFHTKDKVYTTKISIE